MKQITDNVTVNIQDVQGKENKIVRPVTDVELETSDDVLTYAQDKDNLAALIAAANYGFNLKARAKVTAQIKAENQGPEVAISRFVKQLVANAAKNGKTLSEADARAKVLANAEIFGIDLTSGAAA